MYCTCFAFVLSCSLRENLEILANTRKKFNCIRKFVNGVVIAPFIASVLLAVLRVKYSFQAKILIIKCILKACVIDTEYKILT